MFCHIRLLSFFTFLLFLLPFSTAIKFALKPSRFAPPKCIWNAAHSHALVVVTANVSPGPNQRVDIDIIDGSPQHNIYLAKKDIKGETRLAITAHADGEVGVCLRNYLSPEAKNEPGLNMTRTIDLDIDIGAEAVDYNAIANQESLSGLETEMRKLEGVVKEIVDELDYLKKREERFATTNLSTNNRVQNFAWFTLFSLVGLGVWQIFHLRAFFKRKYLID